MRGRNREDMEVKKVNAYITQASQRAQETNGRPVTDEKISGRDVPVEPDRVNLSRGYQEMTQVKKVMMERDEIRVDQVDQLRAAIKTQAYQPDPEQIASKMLDEML
jgi:flagellar biosynthesis anti-sigma factor FlgM